MKVAALLAGIVFASTGATPPARTQLTDAPCTGCRASFPTGPDPVPLLVVLHGDGGHSPTDLMTAWEKHAANRQIAILSLKCPADLGCKGSWWQWNGDPAWLSQQVEAFAKKRAIDRSRVWLAGWSGGASYMGMRSQALQGRFSALVYHGGGLSPGGPCAPSAPAPAPAYFLVGNGNPLHGLAVDLKKHNEGCGIDVTWKLLPGADHPAEWSALDTTGGAIADWLLTKKRS